MPHSFRQAAAITRREAKEWSEVVYTGVKYVAPNLLRFAYVAAAEILQCSAYRAKATLRHRGPRRQP